MNPHTDRRTNWAIGGILAMAALSRGVALDALALTGDEAYYWLWSRHPAWAYYDHPAGVALLVRASTALGGTGELGVRWLNALLGVGCAFLTAQVGQRMLSRRAGLFAALLVALGAPYLITARFVYTNMLYLFLMLLNLITFWRLIEPPRPSPSYAAAFGVSLALLLNTKYSAYLYVIALLIAILLDHRRLLGDRRFWVGLSIGALGLVPVLAWNATHEWASLRWQLTHATTTVARDYSLLRNVRHLLVYLTVPLVALGGAGIGRRRNPAERLLSLLALVLLLPVAVSPANSPRNLASGLVPLLLLAGTRLPPTLRHWRQYLATALLSAGVLGTAIYGVGTVVGLQALARRPQSSIVPAILEDVAGWDELGTFLADQPGTLFTPDYSIAAQIEYYAGRPAYTSWPQYRIWGIPDFDDATIVSLAYLPEDYLTARLRDAFRRVEEPRQLVYLERGAIKEVYVWQAQDLQIDQATFVQRFDFLTLLEEAR
jgi:4-amino-4-deoxy-L-arabinose transferase-like glycosyltransferase